MQAGAQDLTAPPGGLDPSDTPQFLLLTHDDAVNSEAVDAITAMLDGRSSVDGCKAAATFFTLWAGTDCDLVTQMHAAGHEIAGHTLTHSNMLSWSEDRVRPEVTGLPKKLESACGIPKSDVVGFRTPFLEATSEGRRAIAAAGLLYDSSVVEPLRGSASDGEAQRAWPYTLDAGFPEAIDCSW